MAYGLKVQIKGKDAGIVHIQTNTAMYMTLCIQFKARGPFKYISTVFILFSFCCESCSFNREQI